MWFSVEFLDFLHGRSGLPESVVESANALKAEPQRARASLELLVKASQTSSDSRTGEINSTSQWRECQRMCSHLSSATVRCFPWNQMKSLIFKTGLAKHQTMQKTVFVFVVFYPFHDPICPHAQTPSHPLPVSLKPMLKKHETPTTPLAFWDPFIN